MMAFFRSPGRHVPVLIRSASLRRGGTLSTVIYVQHAIAGRRCGYEYSGAVALLTARQLRHFSNRLNKLWGRLCR